MTVFHSFAKAAAGEVPKGTSPAALFLFKLLLSLLLNEAYQLSASVRFLQKQVSHRCRFIIILEIKTIWRGKR